MTVSMDQLEARCGRRTRLVLSGGAGSQKGPVGGQHAGFKPGGRSRRRAVQPRRPQSDTDRGGLPRLLPEAKVILDRREHLIRCCQQASRAHIEKRLVDQAIDELTLKRRLESCSPNSRARFLHVELELLFRSWRTSVVWCWMARPTLASCGGRRACRRSSSFAPSAGCR